MPGVAADEPEERRNLLVRAIADYRRGASDPADGGAGDEALVFEGVGRSVAYADRSLRFDVDDDERERLETLCAEYRVFKVEQPATRKAPAGVVYLSAVTDAKHMADFLEDAFRKVFEADSEYELRIT